MCRGDIGVWRSTSHATRAPSAVATQRVRPHACHLQRAWPGGKAHVAPAQHGGPHLMCTTATALALHFRTAAFATKSATNTSPFREPNATWFAALSTAAAVTMGHSSERPCASRSSRSKRAADFHSGRASGRAAEGRRQEGRRTEEAREHKNWQFGDVRPGPQFIAHGVPYPRRRDCGRGPATLRACAGRTVPCGPVFLLYEGLRW